MKRLTTLTASAAAALGIALAPAPAAASSKDVAKVVAGIAAVAIIAKALEDRKDRGKVTSSSSNIRFGSAYGGNDWRYRKRQGSIQGRILPYDPNDRHGGPKPGRGYKRHALPNSCLRQVATNRGSFLAYGSRCLDRNYRFASKLPGGCQTAVRTQRGFREVFGARCLARDGWKVARR